MRLFENNIINKQENVDIENNNINTIQNTFINNKLGDQLAEFVRTDEEYAKFNKYIK